MQIKKLIILILLLVTSIFTFGQNTHKILYENGELKETGQFDKNEKPTGEWKKYYENGQLWNVLNYENGIFKGEWRFYEKIKKYELVDLIFKGAATKK